ncbi:uncharacterized protein RJT21DRAFT_1704 [Scheffersomyces amazonensis]|uniref:uncharacterized protein n=1 Tax=Scheffersomyces amazonensis TaxID=1078765 RepID=UPI00315CD0E5
MGYFLVGYFQSLLGLLLWTNIVLGAQLYGRNITKTGVTCDIIQVLPESGEAYISIKGITNYDLVDLPVLILKSSDFINFTNILNDTYYNDLFTHNRTVLYDQVLDYGNNIFNLSVANGFQFYETNVYNGLLSLGKVVAIQNEIQFPVQRTGTYCIFIAPPVDVSLNDLSLSTSFISSYGHLEYSDYLLTKRLIKTYPVGSIGDTAKAFSRSICILFISPLVRPLVFVLVMIYVIVDMILTLKHSKGHLSYDLETDFINKFINSILWQGHIKNINAELDNTKINSINTNKSTSSPLRLYKNYNKSPSPSTKTSLTGSPIRKMVDSDEFRQLQSEYSKLERQFADIVLKNNSVQNDFLQLESELNSKSITLQEQNDKLKEYESYIKTIQSDHGKDHDFLQQEIQFYKQYIEELQTKLSTTLTDLKKSQDDSSSTTTLTTTPIADQSFEKLQRDFRVLESNYEVEKNSKLVLMDQIEFLTKENELLNNQLAQTEQVFENSILIHENSEISQIVNTIHTMHELTSDDDDDELDDEDYVEDVNNDSILFQSNINYNNDSNNNNETYDKPLPFEDLNGLYLADEIQHSSPIKQQQQEFNSEESIEVSQQFQFPLPPSNSVFPPSPDPQSKDKKRQSLPSKLKTASPVLNNNEFVLSPLKLANSSLLASNNSENNNNGQRPKSPTIKRYSTSKPHHTRYNSHDIVPIKVEFEQQPSLESQLRSATVPEHGHTFNTSTLMEQDQSRESALSALNGNTSGFESKRHSIMTNSSSKRSSLIMLDNFTSDMTKQEIMKLKFELQSLKLHNEKLLSYIGFELQKQKKNIKKLTKKQSAMSLRNKAIEYSDAKLIERSRELLIQKKRVLRSVSINAILSKNYGNLNKEEAKNNGKIGSGSKHVNGMTGDRIHEGVIGIGMVPLSKQLFNIYENNNENDFDVSINEDDYGFLTHNERYGTRIFSNGLNTYLNFEDINDIDDGDEKDNAGSNDHPNSKNLRKHTSQVFEKKRYSSSTLSEDDDEDDEDYDNEDGDGDGDDDIVKEEEYSSEEELLTGMFNHVKYLVLGANSVKKRRKKKDSLVDDGLKYKFVTIALGIILIAVKFSHQQHYAITTTSNS